MWGLLVDMMEHFGPSGVRVLLAYFSSWRLLVLVLTPFFKTPEGVVVGFQIFAWAAN
jgi:hypothetical protein